MPDGKTAAHMTHALRFLPTASAAILLLSTLPVIAGAQCTLHMQCIGAAGGRSGSQAAGDRASCESQASSANQSYGGCNYWCTCPQGDAGARQRREQQETERKAEEERLRKEKERLKKEEEKRKKEEFEKNKREAVRGLKGQSGTSSGPKGIGPSADTGLKGLPVPNTGLKKGNQDMDVRTAAWQQRECDREIMDRAGIKSITDSMMHENNR